MTVIRHPDTKLDGSAAVKLYGYGGFNQPLGPGFSFGVHNWVQSGGIYVQANLRGGGEFGSDWYEQGILENKQNVFDDFIACAEQLIDENYTSPQRLVIEGGSNGGLLTAACMIQRPELFGAVISAVPVTDMLRFHKFTFGAFWKSDYGSPEDNEAHYRASIAYSPLHNVAQDAEYPPLLVQTADHDDRVVPPHSFKFVAEVQHTASDDNLVLMQVEKDSGHGAGKSTEKIVKGMLDKVAFVEHTIGPLNQDAYKATLGNDQSNDNSGQPPPRP
jgi:prolyl oligopeptidase